jgi:hypothetical protein
LLATPPLFGTVTVTAALAWVLRITPSSEGEPRTPPKGPTNLPSSEGRQAGPRICQTTPLRRGGQADSSGVGGICADRSTAGALRSPTAAPRSAAALFGAPTPPRVRIRAFAHRWTLRGLPKRWQRRGSSEPDASEPHAPCLRGFKPKGAPSGGLAATPGRAQRTLCRPKALRLRDPPKPDRKHAATRAEDSGQRQPTARGHRPR